MGATLDRTPDAGSNAAQQKAHEFSERFELIGRAGWLAKGVVYALIGLLFLRIAWLGGSDEEANQKGALEEIADNPFGSTLLVVLAVGLLLYVIWRLLTVVLPGEWTGRALLDRIGYAISAITYTTVLISIVDVLRTSASSSGNEGEDRLIEGLVKDTLSMTAGRWIVALAGLVVIGIGVAFVKKGWTKSFRDDISGDYGLEGTLTDRLGIVGWIARGAVTIVIGWFLGLAAYRFDPDEAAGFDDSIRQLTETGWGAAFAVAIAIGFIAFGAFSIVSARHRDLEGPRND